MNIAKLLTVNDLAELFDVPPGWIYSRTRMIETDEIPPHIRMGKYLRWHPTDVEEWLARKREKRGE